MANSATIIATAARISVTLRIFPSLVFSRSELAPVPTPQLAIHPHSKRYALPPLLGRWVLPTALLYRLPHYYMKAKYYAILLKKNKRLLKKNLLDACRPSEVPESLQDSYRDANCRV